MLDAHFNILLSSNRRVRDGDESLSDPSSSSLSSSLPLVPLQGGAGARGDGVRAPPTSSSSSSSEEWPVTV